MRSLFYVVCGLIAAATAAVQYFPAAPPRVPIAAEPVQNPDFMFGWIPPKSAELMFAVNDARQSVGSPALEWSPGMFREASAAARGGAVSPGVQVVATEGDERRVSELMTGGQLATIGSAGGGEFAAVQQDGKWFIALR